MRRSQRVFYERLNFKQYIYKKRKFVSLTNIMISRSRSNAGGRPSTIPTQRSNLDEIMTVATVGGKIIIIIALIALLCPS